MSIVDFSQVIESTISEYAENVKSKKNQIRSIVDSFCQDMERVLGNKFSESWLVRCFQAEQSNDNFFRVPDSIKANSEKSLFQVVVFAKHKLSENGLSESKNRHDFGTIAPKEFNYTVFEYRMNEESGFPVYISYNFDKIYCMNEDEFRQEIVQAFKARSSSLLEQFE